MTKLYKNLFFMLIFTSTLISISSYSWLGMWLGLEINLLSIIPLMHSPKNKLSSESSVKYFIVQAIASTMIMMSIIMMTAQSSLMSNMSFQSTIILVMNSSLLTKMGMAPFHFWFPEVMEGLDWMNCLLIMTWQKIAPMILLMYNINFTKFMSTIILISMVVSGFMGVNQVSLRKILAYSSINHMGWMISSMMIMETVWLIYFLIYTVMTTTVVFMMKTFNIFFLAQLLQSMNSDPMTKMFFMMNFLSLAGIPPFLGFLPKWLTIQALVQNNLMFLPTMMIILTLITIYMYVRITLTTMLMNSHEPGWNPKVSLNKFSKTTTSMMNFFSLTSLILITIVFNNM